MSVIIPNIRRGKAKPYASLPRIDWSHPLAKGLIAYNYDMSGSAVDLTTLGQSAINTGFGGTKISVASSIFGTATKYASGVSEGTICSLNAKSESFLSAAPYAIATGFMHTGTPGTDTELCTLYDGTNFGFEIQCFHGGTNHVQVKYVGSNSGEAYDTAAGTDAINVYHTIVANADTSTSGSVYTDGVLDGNGGTFTGANTTISTTSMQMAFNAINQGSSSGTGINGFVYYGAIWNRTLTATEAFTLHNDPYCFLIYPEDELFASLVGAAADILAAQIWM